jgi:hypothetical protein
MKHIDCPLCGFPNPITRDACEFCAAGLKEAVMNDPDVIPCLTCEGTGMVHLQDEDKYEKDPENQCLPCVDCEGTGRKALSDMRAEATKKGFLRSVGALFDLLDIFGK